MKNIDILADRNLGHYVVPKAPIRDHDEEEMRRIITQMKQANEQKNKVK